MIAPLIGMGVQGLAQVLAYYANKQDRPISPYESLMRMQQNAQQGANAATSNQGTLMGQRLAAQGTNNTSAGNSQLSALAERNNATAMRSVDQARPQIEGQYRNELSNWRQGEKGNLTNLLLSLGQGAGQTIGGIAGSQEEDDQFKRLLELIMAQYGGGQGTSAGMNPNLLRLMRGYGYSGNGMEM